MKRLVLIRHAKTEMLHYGITDFERQLETRGINDARHIALHLKGKGFCPQLMISSNASRALQTTQIMAEEVDYTISQIREEAFIYHGYTTGDFLDFLGKMDNKHSEIWVVGHNPDIAMLASKLTSNHLDHFPTSAAAVISFDVNHWNDVAALNGKMDYFVFPKELRD